MYEYIHSMGRIIVGWEWWVSFAAANGRLMAHGSGKTEMIPSRERAMVDMLSLPHGPIS